MSRRFSEAQVQEKHEHVWFGNLCGCGAEKVTYQEYSSRVAEYNKYYELARKSESYALYEVMRSAIKKNDTVLVRECQTRAREILAENVWIRKPLFVDPGPARSRGMLVIV